MKRKLKIFVFIASVFFFLDGTNLGKINILLFNTQFMNLTELLQKKYSNQTIQDVWEKGDTVENYDHNLFRKDQCGAWIKRDHYGNRKSSYGWEIDHITPVADGGGDELSNLRPLQWENNVATSDGRLTCKVKSNGSKNEYTQ